MEEAGQPARATGTRFLAAIARRLARCAAAPFLIGLALSAICYCATGGGLALFFGGAAVLTLTAPAFVLAERSWTDRAIALAAVVAGVAVGWLAPVYNGTITAGEWGQCIVVLASYGLALAALGSLLQRIRIPGSAAAAAAIVIGLLWLSWPMSLSHQLGGQHRGAIVAALVAVHPLFTINGILRTSFPVPWMQYPLAYRLANAMSEIPYSMPRSILACASANLVIGAALAAPAILFERRTLRRDRPAHPPAG